MAKTPLFIQRGSLPDFESQGRSYMTLQRAMSCHFARGGGPPLTLQVERSFTKGCNCHCQPHRERTRWRPLPFAVTGPCTMATARRVWLPFWQLLWNRLVPIGPTAPVYKHMVTFSVQKDALLVRWYSLPLLHICLLLTSASSNKKRPQHFLV